MDDKIAQILDLVKKTGKLRKGCNEATKALEKGNAKLVVYAEDVSPKEVVMHLPLLSKEKGVKCVSVEKKEELGAVVGLTVGTSAIAVIDEGEAKGLIKSI